MNALQMIYLYSAVPAALFMIYALALSLMDYWSERTSTRVPARLVVTVPQRNAVSQRRRAA